MQGKPISFTPPPTHNHSVIPEAPAANNVQQPAAAFHSPKTQMHISAHEQSASGVQQSPYNEIMANFPKGSVKALQANTSPAAPVSPADNVCPSPTPAVDLSKSQSMSRVNSTHKFK